VFLPLQQDFYSKSRHASPQNSSQIYVYAFKKVENYKQTKFPALNVLLQLSTFILWRKIDVYLSALYLLYR